VAADLNDDEFVVVKKKQGPKPSVNCEETIVISGHRPPEFSLPSCWLAHVQCLMGVSGVPRLLEAYVGRLSKDTTADDMTALLNAAGIQDVKCNKKKVLSFQLRPSLFHASRDQRYSNLCYDDNT